MKLYKKQEVVVIDETINFFKIHYATKPDYDAFWAHKADVSETPSKSVAARIAIQSKPAVKVIEASILSPGFAEAVKASNYKIRVLFPPHAEQSLVDSFNKAGVVLPSDIRPQAVGKRKPDAQAPRSWSASVTFPNIITATFPDGTRDAKTPGMLINSKRSVVLALLQAGLVINDYAKA